MSYSQLIKKLGIFIYKNISLNNETIRYIQKERKKRVAVC